MDILSTPSLHQSNIFFGFLTWVSILVACCSCRSENVASDSGETFTLDPIREALVRQEDTIIFSLIERARFPHNSPLYDESLRQIPGFSGSLLQFFVREAEILQSKVLHPAASTININKKIWDMYVNDVLPLFTAKGDDRNYVTTASSDLTCLQALSRRIHYGMFVAEVKYRDAPQDYGPAIRAKDRDALMKLLTSESVEEMVKKRVEKKTSLFSQEVTLNGSGGKYKIEPSVVSRIYGEWVMPMTKVVEVEYLLRRLN